MPEDWVVLETMPVLVVDNATVVVVVAEVEVGEEIVLLPEDDSVCLLYTSDAADD